MSLTTILVCYAIGCSVAFIAGMIYGRSHARVIRVERDPR